MMQEDHLTPLKALWIGCCHSSHHVRIGDHLGVAPHIAIERHVLYEPHIDGQGPCQLHKVCKLIVVDAPHHHHVHLYGLQ